jgi:hypothetical protein
MAGRVEGKAVSITGAARGQGRVTRSGWRPSAGIVAVDICVQAGSVPYPMATPEDLAQTVQEVSALGRRRAESSAPSTDKPR